MATTGIGRCATSVNYEEASKFIDCLYQTNANLTFQTFDNSAQHQAEPQVLHGTLQQHWDRFVAVNLKGLGIYALVNAGDGRGRKTENITAITSVFLDLDNAPLEPVVSCPLKPHAILQTSPERFQVRWRIEPIPVTPRNLESARRVYYGVQRGIANYFDGDPANVDLARVARIPGLFNCKNTPFLIRTVELNPEPVYTIKDFIQALDIDLTQPMAPEKQAMRVDFGSCEPVDHHRHDFVWAVAATLASRGVSPDVILQTTHEQNRLRCLPPVPDKDVKYQVDSVVKHWYSAKINVGEMVDRIMDDHKLLWFNGGFYRYDTRTGAYRPSELRRYRRRVEHEIKEGKVSPGDIARVINRLAKVTATDAIPGASPELKFLSQHLPRGQKVILRNLYRTYRAWCRSRSIKPVSQPELRIEIECRLGIKKTKIRKGRKVVWGFNVPDEC